jgi:hypothetical protein
MTRIHELINQGVANLVSGENDKAILAFREAHKEIAANVPAAMHDDELAPGISESVHIFPVSLPTTDSMELGCNKVFALDISLGQLSRGVDVALCLAVLHYNVATCIQLQGRPENQKKILSHYKRCVQLLNEVLTAGGYLFADIAVASLLNMAVLYFDIGTFEKCAAMIRLAERAMSPVEDGQNAVVDEDIRHCLSSFGFIFLFSSNHLCGTPAA